MTPEEGLTWTVPEVARLLGIGRGLAYELVQQGRLPALRLGRRLVVPRAALTRMLAGGVGASSPDLDGSACGLPLR